MSVRFRLISTAVRDRFKAARSKRGRWLILPAGRLRTRMRIIRTANPSNCGRARWGRTPTCQARSVPKRGSSMCRSGSRALRSTTRESTPRRGGDLVFQGQAAGKFSSYDARTGKRLWSIDVPGAVLAPPITYRVGGRQYVSVLTGMGQTRRLLTFGLDGKAAVAPGVPYRLTPVADLDYTPDKGAEDRGGLIFVRCSPVTVPGPTRAAASRPICGCRPCPCRPMRSIRSCGTGP